MVRKNLCSLFVAMLLIAAARHYGWELFPSELKGMASKGLGGVTVLFLLWTLNGFLKSDAFVPLLVWWYFEELQIVVCSAWYMIEPWPVPDGAAICSAKFGVDLGAFGILCVALLVWLSTRQPLQVRE